LKEALGQEATLPGQLKGLYPERSEGST
jgi:hypothetical protein